MDICDLKNAEVEPKLQKYKGRVVLRRDIVKDVCAPDDCSKIMDVTARFPGCEGQTADAVSAYTQVKLEDAPECPKILSQNVQTFGYVFHDTNGRSHGQSWKIPWYRLNETCTVIH